MGPGPCWRLCSGRGPGGLFAECPQHTSLPSLQGSPLWPLCPYKARHMSPPSPRLTPSPGPPAPGRVSVTSRPPSLVVNPHQPCPNEGDHPVDTLQDSVSTLCWLFSPTPAQGHCERQPPPPPLVTAPRQGLTDVGSVPTLPGGISISDPPT